MGDWDKPGLKGGDILALNSDGSVWVEIGISNPLGYSKEIMLDTGSKVGKGVPMIALFAPNGNLRGYVLIRPPMGNPIIPIGDALYIQSGDTVSRWGPIGR